MLTNIHELLDFFENRDHFLSAVEYTASQHGFRTELIEKDFLCTMVLMHMYDNKENPLTFKGGTLLAKVHAGFYRLSEDLDFSLSLPSEASRNQRRTAIKPIKEIIGGITTALPIFKFEIPLKGSNESRQYNAELRYQSKLTGIEGKILIDIGLREQHLQPSEYKEANTLLIDPFTSDDKVGTYPIKCLSLQEAYAEKMRAALTRKKPAIRDYFDIFYAKNNKLIDFQHPQFIDLLKSKLSVPDNGDIALDNDKIALLTEKIDTELFPTLKQNDDYKFDLTIIINELKRYAKDYLHDYV